ncbi:ribokinase [Bacillus canaveralius]|uniref:Ribokinase n=1 Tax=Bacillus canaveralius TaxID=1403243 RepID=A0A2N5GI17_9BACI|nr:ribokinase [Bacillus canaveralius]PLR80549.1 ribokinase [Bacillus canaveralius]PLR92497.1 ribokinase [Bacillus canaveralius]
MARIAVIGSINMDLVVETDKSPKKGETVLGNQFFTSHGGKGANQAVAVARLGGSVTMFGSLGNDQNGKSLKDNLVLESIETTYINMLDNVSSGVAVIEICEKDNRIIVIPGANQHTNIEYLSTVKEVLLNFDVIIMQMEIPIEALQFIIKFLSENKKVIILNPAPALPLPEDVLSQVTYITPNEHEYKIVLNTSHDIEASLRRYPNKLLITCGEKGVKYHNGSNVETIPSIKVDVVDTTGAGDTFTAAFGIAISEGRPLHEAIRFANIAAGLSITKIGAQQGMPTRKSVTKLLDS